MGLLSDMPKFEDLSPRARMVSFIGAGVGALLIVLVMWSWLKPAPAGASAPDPTITAAGNDANPPAPPVGKPLLLPRNSSNPATADGGHP